MATVTKRGNTYRIRVSCGYDSTGKQIMRSKTWEPNPGMTVKQIERDLQRQTVLFEERCRSGQFLDGSIKFAEFAERWIHDHAEKQLKAKTVARYKTLLIRINQGIGHIRLDKLQPHHILDFCNNLAESCIREDLKYKASCDLRALIKEKGYTMTQFAAESGVSKTIIYSACSGKNISGKVSLNISTALKVKNAFRQADEKVLLSDRTQLHYFRLISSILTSAVQWQAIPYNVCTRVKAPTVKQKEAKFLDDVQVSQLFKYLEDTPIDYRVLVHLLLYTGLRRGELLGLKWSDIDFDNSLLHVRRTLLYLPEMGLYEDDPKTDASNRIMKVSAGMMTALKSYKAWQGEQKLRMGDKWQDIDYLFTRWNGEPMRPDTLSDWFRKFIKKTDLPPISLHSLRHTCATLQIMNGIPVRTVSARLGHAKTSTTSNIYSHAIQTLDAKAAQVLDDVLTPKKAKYVMGGK